MQALHTQTAAVSGTAMIPMALLLLENDDDRQLIGNIYTRYRTLLYKVAYRYFPDNMQEMEDAVGNAVLNLCRYSKSIRAVSEDKLPAYLVCITRNECNALLKKLARRRKMTTVLPDDEDLSCIADERSSHDVVLSRHTAEEILDSFRGLTEREREVIRLRHIDMLDYEEIGQILGLSYGAARTAVSRAKQKLEKLAGEQEERV